jgi:hypothetical protein
VVFAVFFVVASFASWPVRTKRAKYSFFLLTIGLYLGGAIIFVPLAGLASNLLLGSPGK